MSFTLMMKHVATAGLTLLFLWQNVMAEEVAKDAKQHPKLQTFYVSRDHLPTKQARVEAGRLIVKAIQDDSIINISTKGIFSSNVIKRAYKAQKDFFSMPLKDKMACSNDMSYGGYVYSGEEDTAGKKDAAEIFTVTRDFPVHHKLVQEGIPCHGPVPWPFEEFQAAMTDYASAMRAVGDTVLPLIALGLDMDEDAFDDMTSDSWGHMRVLKFREANSTDMLQGIHAHTDYGMLVLATQDDVGGLWVRPHNDCEERKDNWKESSAGDFQEEERGWKFVVPEPDVITCFPGDMLQFITRGALMSTPHKVELADRVRYAIAYFHEPSFGAVLQRTDKEGGETESVHYGEHFTNMFKRCYPDKSVTKKIVELGLDQNLETAKTSFHTF